MRITVGTFNLNNLFSRYNFQGEVDVIKTGKTDVGSTISYEFVGSETHRYRTYKGKLVKGKPAKERELIASRIRSMDVDVLAIQEVEDIDTLRRFASEDLKSMYAHAILVEGNDPRLIDIGVLSKYPVGAITSWQTAVHQENPGITVFGRDLLQIEILNPTRTQKLFTVFNTHLKSHFVPYYMDKQEGIRANNERRRQQAECISQIISATMRPDSRYILLGDMNDPVNSDWLKTMRTVEGQKLVNALEDPKETRPPKPDTPSPASTAWTHRYKESGLPASYELYDQIWASPALAEKQTGAWIDRRTKHGGDGSDHDPAWIEIEL